MVDKHRHESFFVSFHMSSVCVFLQWNAHKYSKHLSGFSMEKLFYAQGETMVRYQEQLAVLGGLDNICS